MPGKPSDPDASETGGKWNESALAGDGSPSHAGGGGGLLLDCLWGCVRMAGGTLHTLNWNYLRSRELMHGPASTTTAVGSRTAGSWADAEN